MIGAEAGSLGFNDSLFNDTVVRVSGTVREFNRTEVEAELSYSLNDPIFDDWVGQPVLIADSIEQVRAKKVLVIGAGSTDC